jgi:trans-2,3-dihydro-3-hydroxyanthranilate isomerase
MGGIPVDLMVVDACLRNGLADVDLARVPSRTGTSHVAVVYPRGSSGGTRTLRFFTTEGELLACGHGTIAAIAVLSLQGARKGFQGLRHPAGRDLEATGIIRAERGPSCAIRKSSPSVAR